MQIAILITQLIVLALLFVLAWQLRTALLQLPKRRIRRAKPVDEMPPILAEIERRANKT